MRSVEYRISNPTNFSSVYQLMEVEPAPERSRPRRESIPRTRGATGAWRVGGDFRGRRHRPLGSAWRRASFFASHRRSARRRPNSADRRNFRPLLDQGSLCYRLHVIYYCLIAASSHTDDIGRRCYTNVINIALDCYLTTGLFEANSGQLVAPARLEFENDAAEPGVSIVHSIWVRTQGYQPSCLSCNF